MIARPRETRMTHNTTEPATDTATSKRLARQIFKHIDALGKGNDALDEKRKSEPKSG